MGKSTVNRHIAVAEVYKKVASTGAKILPTSERQMRPLLRLRSTNQRDWSKVVPKVWTKVVEDAEISKIKEITQKHVIRALEQLGFDISPVLP